MKKLLFTLLLCVSCNKEEKMVINDDSDLIGIWELKAVELILFENSIDLTEKINDCERKEHLSIENLNKVVWVSYFPWLNEQTSICSERA